MFDYDVDMFPVNKKFLEYDFTVYLSIFTFHMQLFWPLMWNSPSIRPR